jgi:hypothetical protein
VPLIAETPEVDKRGGSDIENATGEAGYVERSGDDMAQVLVGTIGFVAVDTRNAGSILEGVKRSVKDLKRGIDQRGKR